MSENRPGRGTKEIGGAERYLDMEVAASVPARMTDEPVVVASFETFYAATHDRAFRALVAVLRDQDKAADSLGTAYLRALSQWSKVASHPNPEAWLLRVAMNDATSVWRRFRRIVPLPDQGAIVSPPEASDPDLVRALARLPLRQRQVVVLRFLVGMSGGETGSNLGIAEGTVGAHLTAAMRTLRRELNVEEAAGGTE